MKRFISFVLILNTLTARSQNADSIKQEASKKIYRAAATKINDLVNTRLEVKFDYDKHTCMVKPG